MVHKYTDEKLLEIIENIKEECKETYLIPNNRYIVNKYVSIQTLDRICIKLFNDRFEDYLRSLGYKRLSDFKLNNKYVSKLNIEIDELYELVEIYVKQFNAVPKLEDFKYKNNLPSWETVNKILKENVISINDFFLKIGRIDNPRSQKYYYDNYVEKFIKTYREKGHIKSVELNKNIYGLPSANWLVNNCPDKKIKTYNDFVIWCGLKPFHTIPKETVIKIIYHMQSKLDRPITAEDFNNPKKDEVGIRTIRRIWGEVHIMQDELGLKLTGKHATKDIEEVKSSIIKVCNLIYEKYHRKTITYKDINSFDFTLCASTYSRIFAIYNSNLRSFIKSIGFDLQKEGMGLNHKFEDGEKVLSQYEFNFSNYLRDELNLKYNKDYFRDIKYRTFAKECKGNFNCDYIINYKVRKIYIEIAGMLPNHNNENLYNKELKSKTKEKYRKHLIYKESLLKLNNLEHYIIFPCDCNKEFFNAIFNKEVRIWQEKQ